MTGLFSIDMKSSKPIYIIIGTRAQLIKMAPLMQLLEKNSLPFTFIYTQQHKVTIDDLIDNFEIKTPYISIINRSEEAKTIKLFAGWAMQMLVLFINPFSYKKVLPNGRGIILTHGDTATTAWSAIYGRTRFCKVVHVESGLRSHNIFKPFPEEIMRLVTFVFSNYYICPGDWAVKNLRYFPGKKINVKTNPMYDSLMYALGLIKKGKFSTKFKLPSKYAIVSIHRYENIFKEDKLKLIIDYLEEISHKIKLVMVLHPATEKQLHVTGLHKVLFQNPNITLLPRQDFLSFVEINVKAEFAITDGGSNQEEMSYIGKPTILFRDITERQEGLGENIVLSKFDKNVIMDFVENYRSFRRKPLELKDSPSELTFNFVRELALHDKR